MDETIFDQPYEARIVNIASSSRDSVDWKKIKFENLNWDLELRGLPWQVVRANYFKNGIDESKFTIGYPLCHCIGGQYGNNNYYCYPLYRDQTDQQIEDMEYTPHDPGPTKDNLKEFSGDAPTWGIFAEGTNYLRKGEMRQGGTTKILRNSKWFYEIQTGSYTYGISRALSIVEQLKDHPVFFSERNWRKNMLKRKVWYDGVPAIVTSIIEEQGCVILAPDPKFNLPFKISPWMIENDGTFGMMGGHDSDFAKCEYLYDKIYWYREDQQTEKYIDRLERT